MENTIDWSGVELTKCAKNKLQHNPVMTQAYGADPWAMVYGDRVYFYMTADAYEYDEAGEIKENGYGKIRSIHVISTADLVNFEDHGLIPVAGEDGIAKWARNSWAPAVAWKEIDGQAKFFLYFADNGGGIGVLTAESPVGPFTDPLGHGLITRSTPNCANVEWLFDPAVLVDDDGRAYLYFGGGVPAGKAADPGTARIAELGADMVSITSEPQRIDVPYLFEDSGIHKANNKYYYTYCTNFNVDHEGTAEFGFVNGEIASMESDSPMGPFVFKEKILENPGTLCGLGSNNHHCVFNFKDQWYMAYHSRQLEKKMGVEHGYRSTNINAFTMDENGTIGIIKQSFEGVEQVKNVNPYEVQSAVMVTAMAGTDAVPVEQGAPAYGTMALGKINTGDYVWVSGVDFGANTPKKLVLSIANREGKEGAVRLGLGFPNKETACLMIPEGKTDGYVEMSVELTKEMRSSEITGVQDVFFVFYGEGYEIRDWRFE